MAKPFATANVDSSVFSAYGKVEQVQTDLKTYKARWAGFLIDCANLNSARCHLATVFANEDLDASWEERCDRVKEFEARIAHLSVDRRASELRREAYRYEDM